MKTEQIQSLESYFKTNNEHWNRFAFGMLCEILQQGQFENPELPLQLLNIATNTFVEHHETPLQAVQQFADELDKNELSAVQKIFVYKCLCNYLNQTEYDKIDLTPIKKLLKSQNDKLKSENEPKKPQVRDIRETLKEIMQKEFEQLPETLKGLEPVQRLTILCKLAPYVLPKIDAVNLDHGERGIIW